VIITLGDKQFDVAVSKAAHNRLIGTRAGFYAVQTRLTDKDPLIIKYSPVRVISRILASYAHIIKPLQQA
jgi:hypothetical protein